VWGGRRKEREFFADNLLVQIHCIIGMIRWTGLAPWEFEFPFPGSLISTFLGRAAHLLGDLSEGDVRAHHILAKARTVTFEAEYNPDSPISTDLPVWWALYMEGVF